jgi:hypothetical protein
MPLFHIHGLLAGLLAATLPWWQRFLQDHPAVLQVVTFAVPHDKLGEDVAAAVVCGRARLQPNKNFVRSCLSAWQHSRRRERFSSWPRFQRARQASYNASVWRKNWGSADFT